MLGRGWSIDARSQDCDRSPACLEDGPVGGDVDAQGET
jgi:hypothetical protein